MGFTRDALDALQRHDWPGNVRELKGVIQRAVARCSGPRITSTQLAPILNYQRQSRGGTASSSRPHLPMRIRPLKEAKVVRPFLRALAGDSSRLFRETLGFHQENP